MYKKKYGFLFIIIVIFVLFYLVLLRNKHAPIVFEKANAITVACVNFNPEWGDKKTNLQKIKNQIIKAAQNDADIVIFPELALTGYSISNDKKMHKLNAETIPGPSTSEILKLTQKYDLFVIFGMPEKSKDNPEIYYNSAAVVGPKKIEGAYRKLMPYPNELTWCTKGNLPFYFNTQWGIVGIGICYDTFMFPELPRFYAALGARLYINVTAISPFLGWKEYYLNQLNARAIENMMYVASANLTGKDLWTNFLGTSLIVGPAKKNHMVKYYCSIADEDKEEIVIATIDLSNVDRMRKKYPLFSVDSEGNSPQWRLDLYINMLKIIKEKTYLDTLSNFNN
ncbi:MAG: carbon-nitrogen hydrolase family protein [Candidatus Thorarchaeota archaeon]